MKFYIALLLSLVFCANLCGQKPPSAPSANREKLSLYAPITLADKNMDFFYNVPKDECVFRTTENVYRGEKFAYMPMAINVVKKDGDKFKLKFKIILKKPDGAKDNIIAEEVYEGLCSNRDTIVPMPVTVLFNFDDTDAYGEYEFIFEARNELTGEKAKITTPVKLLKWESPAPYNDENKFADEVIIFNSHYDPNRLYAYFTSDFFTYEMKGFPIDYYEYSFLKHGFTKHDFLLKHLAENFKKFSEDTRISTAILFESLGKLDMLKDAHEGEKKFAKEVVADAEKNANMLASPLDSLWGEFFATGRYEPVEKLIAYTIKYKTEGKKVIEKIKDKSLKEMPNEEMRNGLNYLAASWSIGLNITKNKLLESYVSYKFAQLSEEERGIFLDALNDGKNARRKK